MSSPLLKHDLQLLESRVSYEDGFNRSREGILRIGVTSTAFRHCGLDSIHPDLTSGAWGCSTREDGIPMLEANYDHR